MKKTSDRNEIEASRAHRRRSFAGGPSSPIASIAIAVADAKKSKSIKFSDENSSALGRNGDASKPKSAFWQRASQIGHVDHDAEGAVTGRQRGFDVVAAVRRVHGLTIQQLKERLDILSESKKKVRTPVRARVNFVSVEVVGRSSRPSFGNKNCSLKLNTPALSLTDDASFHLNLSRNEALLPNDGVEFFNVNGYCVWGVM